MPRNTLVDEFIQRLIEAERSRDSRELARLFSPTASLVNHTTLSTHQGPKGKTPEPLTYWSQYIHAFAVIKSRFTHVIDNGKTAVLEWQASGALASGFPVNYAGVSILEYDGGRIERFRTYYDSAALLPHVQKTGKPFSETVGAPEISTQATS